ncbi:MAG: hypothetical protein ABI165_12150 [Bryobacteraceae bacterium]
MNALAPGTRAAGFAGVALLALFPSLLCAAGLAPPLSVDELVAQSDTIVRGKVIRSWGAMDSENRFIWTHYEVRVSTTLKGQPGATVVIGEPGGTLNGVTLLVPGATHYEAGEEVALFLYRTPIGYLRTTNYGQGKFTISTGGRIHGNTGIESLEGLRWAQFESRIARAVSAQKAVRR